jgi:hypothetical protein
MLPLTESRQPFGLQALGGVLGTAVVTLTVGAAVLVLVLAFLAERRGTGEPSFLTRIAVAEAARAGRPLWERFPFRIVLAGLALGLLGWRCLVAGGPLQDFAIDTAAVGLALALLGGVLAGALAHPPASVVAHEPDEIAHPVRAHRGVGPGRRAGAGPVSAVVVVVAGALALVTTPIATVWRLLAGGSAGNSTVAHHIVLAAVGAICLGAWGLLVEGRRAAAAAGREHHLRLDLAEVAAGCAALLGLSVMVDSGLPEVLAGAVGAVVLVAARIRGSAGAPVRLCWRRAATPRCGCWWR